MEMNEKEVLGCFMVSDRKYPALSKVEDWMFEGPECKRLFAILRQADKALKEDIVKLRELSKTSASFVSDMLLVSEAIRFSEVPVIDIDIEQWVTNKYTDLIKKFTKEGQLGKIQRILNKMHEPEGKGILERYSEYEKGFGEYLDGGLLGFSTGLNKLDKHTLGLVRGQIWVVGAYYGYGKTFLMLNFVESALKQGKRTLLITLEMTAEEILSRLICLTSGLGPVEIFLPLSFEKAKARDDAKEFWYKQISEGNLVILDDVREVDDVVVKLATNTKFDFVCVDYVQLLSSGPNQYESLRDAMKTLQMLTKQYQFTLLLLSQISNEAQRAGAGSLIDGFKGAGDIGQIANVAMRVIRNRDEDTGEWEDFFGLNVTKVRHGVGRNLTFKIVFPGGRIVDNDILDSFEEI